MIASSAKALPSVADATAKGKPSPSRGRVSAQNGSGALARGATGLVAAFGLETFEVVGVVVDVAHGFGEDAVTGLLGDQSMHLLAYLAVLGVALRPGAQLEHVHGLAGV